MSTTESDGADLLAIVDRVVAQAVNGEQLEAFVSRGGDTEVRIYEGEGLICPARTPTNIRLYSENDVRRVLWIRHLTRERGVNLAGIRILFELEERLGARILEALYAEGTGTAERRTQPGSATGATATPSTAEPTVTPDPDPAPTR